MPLFFLALPGASAEVKAGSDSETDVALVMEVNERLNAEMLRANASAVDTMLSDQFVATDPSNTVRNKDDLVAVVSRGLLKYESFESEVEAARKLGDDLVVLMGTETTTQSAVPADGELEDTATGTKLKRRFTNLFRKEDGEWRLLLKQSTVIAVERI